MVELLLERSEEDRRRYHLNGVGSLHWRGWLTRTTELTTRDGQVFVARRTGLRRHAAVATDTHGSVVADYDRDGYFGPGGPVRWGNQFHHMTSDRGPGHRYVLDRLGTPVVHVRIEGYGWSQSRVRVVLEDPSLDPGLVLFAVYLAQVLTSDSNRAAAGGGGG